MERPYNIFTQYVQPINAITYYRILSPLQALYKKKLIVVGEDDLNPATTDRMRNELLTSSDIAWTHCVPGCQLWRNYDVMDGMVPVYMPQKRLQVKYPPIWVVDVDDTYDWVSPTNPSFATWGVRDLEGNLMPIGGQMCAFTKGGRVKVIYEDGKRIEGNKDKIVFNLKENYKRIAKFQKLVNQARAVTVSTPELGEHLQKNLKPREVIVYPNCVKREDYDLPELVPHKGVRVLWQGGSSHHDDWRSVYDAMIVCAKRFPDVTWVFYGQEYSFITKLFKNKEVHEWIDFSAHAMRLHCLDADINLIPLEPNNFSLGKSAIKFYEASALRRPAVSLARRTAPYTEITDGKTGMLYDTNEEFIEKLGALIKDAQLRREMAEGAHKWVWANRDVDKEAPKLLKQLVRVREAMIKEKGDLRELFGASEKLDPEVADYALTV